MKQNRKIYLIILISSLVLGLGLRAHADDEEKTQNGIKYACTGVGDAKDDPKWANYAAKLMFTTGGRAYVSYVQVKIKDASGKVVLVTDCDAPWLVMNLQPGTYSVTATALKKYIKTVSFTVGGGKQSSLAIRFPEITEGME
jgi:hypothetical protein